jgi:hypothetical protein
LEGGNLGMEEILSHFFILRKLGVTLTIVRCVVLLIKAYENVLNENEPNLLPSKQINYDNH